MALEIEDLDLEEASAEHLLMAVSGEDSKVHSSYQQFGRIVC
jgi:hypothetical protein